MESAGSSPRSFAALVQQVKRQRSGGATGAGRTPPVASFSAYPQISQGSQPVFTHSSPPPHLGTGRAGRMPPIPVHSPGENVTEQTSIMTPVGSGSLAGTDPYAGQDQVAFTTPTPVYYPPFVSDPGPHHRSPLAPYVVDEDSSHTPPAPSPMPLGSLNLAAALQQRQQQRQPTGLGIGLQPVSPLPPPAPHAPVFETSSSDSRPTEIELTDDNLPNKGKPPPDDNSPGNAKLRDNALYDASLAGNLEDVKVLLNHGANPNARGGFYYNPLQAAAHLGRTEIVVALLRAGADVNARGGHYGTPMVAAAFGQHIDTVRVLCNWAADPNVVVEYYGTALTATCTTGNEDIASILLRYGSDVNAIGGFYGTALQAAARFGSKELVEMLLQRGADVGAVAGHFGNAIRAAAFNDNHKEIVQLLRKHGAGNYPRMRSRSVQVDTGLGVGGHVGDALILAAQKGQILQLTELLSQGADANARGSAAAPFANALQAAAFGGFTDVIELLLRNGANINSTNGHLGTPLQAAVCSLYENPDVVRLLLRHNANPNLKCGYFGTPLIAAAYFGHVNIIRILVQAGAELNANGGTYASPIDAARAALNRDVERLLIHLGARDPEGEEYEDPNGMISYMEARKDVPKPREPSVDYTTAAALAQVYKIQGTTPGTSTPAPGELKAPVKDYPAAAAAPAQMEATLYRSQSSSLQGSPVVQQGAFEKAPPLAVPSSKLLQVPGTRVEPKVQEEAEEEEEEEEEESGVGISPVASNVTAIPASYTPVSMPPDDVRRHSERRSSRPTPTPSAHLEPTTVYSVTSTGVALEELIATEENWEEILELLPDDLQAGLSFKINLGNPVWTSLSSTHVNPLPLFIANAPVITPLLPIAPSATISIPPPAPVQPPLPSQPAEPQQPATTFDDIINQSPTDNTRSSPLPIAPQQPLPRPPPPQAEKVIPDPLPFQLDPSKPFTPEIIARFFETFTRATGFYALFDGNLQVLQPQSVKQLYDSQPRIFGGMRVSYHTTNPDFNSAVVGAGMVKVRGWRDKLMRSGSSAKKGKQKLVAVPYASVQTPHENGHGNGNGNGNGNSGMLVPQISTIITGGGPLPKHLTAQHAIDARKSPATGIAQGTANVRCSSRVVIKGQKGRNDVECRVGVRVHVRGTSMDASTLSSSTYHRRSRFGGYAYGRSAASSGEESGGEGETYLTTASHAVFNAADIHTVVRTSDQVKNKRRMSQKIRDANPFLRRNSVVGNTNNVVRYPVARDVAVFTKYGRRKVAGNLMIPLGEVAKLSSSTASNTAAGSYAFEDHDVAFIRPDPLADVGSVVSPAKGFYDSSVDACFGRQCYFLCYNDDDNPVPVSVGVSRSNSRRVGNSNTVESVEDEDSEEEENESGTAVQMPALAIGQAVFRSGWTSDVYAPMGYIRRCVLYRIYPPMDDVSLRAWSGVALIVRGRTPEEQELVLGFHSFRHAREEGGRTDYDRDDDDNVVLESEDWAEGSVRAVEKAARGNVFGAVVVPPAWLGEEGLVRVL